MKKLLTLLLLVLISIVANSQHHMMSVLASQVSGAGNAVYEDNGGIVYSSTATIDVPYPSTINANDILIIQVAMSHGSGDYSTPSGWTLIHVAKGGDLGIGCFWKRATGSESGTVTVTNDETDHQWGVMPRFSGCVTTESPLETTLVVAPINSTTITIPAMTGNGSLAFAFISVEDNVLLTEGSEYVEDYQILSGSGTDANLAGFSYSNSSSSTPSDELSLPSLEYISLVSVIFK